MIQVQIVTPNITRDFEISSRYEDTLLEDLYEYIVKRVSIDLFDREQEENINVQNSVTYYLDRDIKIIPEMYQWE